MSHETPPQFNQLGLSKSVIKALCQAGYETPSPIQARTIPLLMSGKDVLGEAQTGTGKTAAFALPVLSSLRLDQKQPQVLVLTPTRELAIQVAQAFQKYASDMKGFHVLPVYGGQDYRGQIRALARGVHVIVGTPGRVMDHMRRGTLALENLTTLVLDEADEMLRMGFIDDVEWILEKTPGNRQIALFSATMPTQIREIANKHLDDPAHITIKVKTTTAETIRQRYWQVNGLNKLDALTRILEGEDYDAMLIFVRTKTATVELAEKLTARGYSCTALNGDIAQNQRERTIELLKNGKIDILVATDVAARGLDVERISHVINYDIPYDSEAYVHRIGRTGRAGRSGDAILFVAPREKHLLTAIEKATRKKIERMELPSVETINSNRIARFKQRITDTIASEDLALYTKLLEQYHRDNNVMPIEIGAALARLLVGNKSLLLSPIPDNNKNKSKSRESRQNKSKEKQQLKQSGTQREVMSPQPGQQRYRIEVGHNHNVKPGHIVGAIANESGLESQHIGQISIFNEFSLVDLPVGMPKEIYKELQKTRVSGQQLRISLWKNNRLKKSDRPKQACTSGVRNQARKPNKNKRVKKQIEDCKSISG